MSIRQTITVTCDKCGREAVVLTTTLKPSAEWTYEDGKDFCPKCSQSLTPIDNPNTLHGSVPPLDINSIPAGVVPIESEGDANPVGSSRVRSKPFMEFDPANPDYEGQEHYGE